MARPSAGEGSKYGQLVLGRHRGKRVAQLRLAAAQGYDAALCWLGNLCSMGLYFAQDRAEALRWYKLAAAQGLGVALRNVGACNHMGYGVAADRAEAIRWYKRAAAAGDSIATDALKRLGVM